MKRTASALVLALGIALLAPTGASAGPEECARTARQIAHYDVMVEKAEAEGKKEWAAKTQAHINTLRAAAVPRCPELAHDPKAAARAFAKLMKLGAKAAMMYFTGGAF